MSSSCWIILIILLLFLVGIVKSESDFNHDLVGAFGHIHTDDLASWIAEDDHNHNDDHEEIILSLSDMYANNNNNPNVKLVPNKLSYNQGDILSLSYSYINSSQTCKSDFIGIYFPSTAQSYFLGYLDLLQITWPISPNNNIQLWTLLNLRAPLVFRYYSDWPKCSNRKKKSGFTFQGESSVIQPNDVNEITQVHISITSQLDEIAIQWTTNEGINTPIVLYGITPELLDQKATGTSHTYTASQMCEGLANNTDPRSYIDVGYMHVVILQNLESNTIYYYQLGNYINGFSTDIFSFTSRRVDNEYVRFITIADMGVNGVQKGALSTMNSLTAEANTGDLDFILHLGDISYARSVGVYWEKYMSDIQSFASSIPYLVGIGNHEYDHVTDIHHNDPSGTENFRPRYGNYGWDSKGECAVPIVNRFITPKPINSNPPFWWSFNYGPVHFLIFSSEHNFTVGSIQYEWIKSDLETVNRNITPWIITGEHRPFYSPSTKNSKDDDTDSPLHGKDGGIATHMQQSLEPLFYKYHVDINMFGHVHKYQRYCAVYNYTCVDSSIGTVHILLGNAGAAGVFTTQSHQQEKLTSNELDSNSVNNLNNNEANNSKPPSKLSVYGDNVFGYTTIFANATTLHFQYFHNVGHVLADEFILNK